MLYSCLIWIDTSDSLVSKIRFLKVKKVNRFFFIYPNFRLATGRFWRNRSIYGKNVHWPSLFFWCSAEVLPERFSCSLVCIVTMIRCCPNNIMLNGLIMATMAESRIFISKCFRLKRTLSPGSFEGLIKSILARLFGFLLNTILRQLYYRAVMAGMLDGATGRMLIF